MDKQTITELTHKFKPGDAIMFSGFEHVMQINESTGVLENVYFGIDQNSEPNKAYGIILKISEDQQYGGEAEIYCDGQTLIMPWLSGNKPELFVIKESKC